MAESITGLLYQLQDLLKTITDKQYSEKVSLLSNASIGEHTRHVIEFFLELEKGYDTGHVNYNARSRDYELETQRRNAVSTILTIASHLERENRSLTIVADFGGDVLCQVPTSYERELLYNLEHTIHHMALLRIGVQAVSAIKLPDNFGIAFSTLKYRKACAQ